MLDPFVTLLEVHKLMYLLQASGEDLRLRYEKATHGPYATNLSHVLNAVEGHLLSGYSGYADGGDNPNKQISIIPGAEQDAKEFLLHETDTANRISQIAELVNGFETPFGMELLTTVHWVACERARTMADIIDHTYEWGVHKRKFSERQIVLATERLAGKGWIPVTSKTRYC